MKTAKKREREREKEKEKEKEIKMREKKKKRKRSDVYQILFPDTKHLERCQEGGGRG